MGIYPTKDEHTSAFDCAYLDLDCGLVSNESPRAYWRRDDATNAYQNPVASQPNHTLALQPGQNRVALFHLHTILEFEKLTLSLAQPGTVRATKTAPYDNDSPPIVCTFNVGTMPLDLMDHRTLFVPYRDCYCELTLHCEHAGVLSATAKEWVLEQDDQDGEKKR